MIKCFVGDGIPWILDEFGLLQQFQGAAIPLWCYSTILITWGYRGTLYVVIWWSATKIKFQRGANRGCGDKYLESFYTIIWVSLTFLCDRAKQYIFMGNNNFFCYRIVLHIYFRPKSWKLQKITSNFLFYTVPSMMWKLRLIWRITIYD